MSGAEGDDGKSQRVPEQAGLVSMEVRYIVEMV